MRKTINPKYQPRDNTHMSDPPTKKEEFFIILEGMFRKKNLTNEYIKERPSLEKTYDKLTEHFQNRYLLKNPIGLGASGIVCALYDVHSKTDRAVKFSRPSENESIVESLKKEGSSLQKLKHPNIVTIYEVDVVEDSDNKKVGYIITEFIDGGDWADQVKSMLLPGYTPDAILNSLIRILYDVVKGLEYMHKNNFVHMDIKASNVLITKEQVAKITDLGFTKNIKEHPDNITNTGFTNLYAHPEVLDYHFTPAASGRFIIPEIRRKEFHSKWDRYALGQSLLEILKNINETFPDDAIHKQMFRYLHLMACRMLDGKNGNPARSFNEFAAGLPQEAMVELRYDNTNHMVFDIEKELKIWTPEGYVPELNFYSRETIRCSETISTIFTPRLRELLYHPLVARLSRISQLGLVRFIYPTASHSRFDHVLGTFANTCAYIDALYRDENPLFRQLINKCDMESLMLASLLHDLGQYPCAHDLEEVNNDYRHEEFTTQLLDDTTQDQNGKTLKAIIEAETGWNSSVSSIKDILKAGKLMRNPQTLDQPSIRSKLLSTIINGPIDADKTDYLMRDSRELRLYYGNAIDFERLMKTITIHYDSNKKLFALAVYDKGRACAESIALTRYLMFSSAYWHHTSRAYKAMLQYAFQITLTDLSTKNPAIFRNEFKENIVKLQLWQPKKSIHPLINELFNVGPEKNLTESDVLLLDFLYQRAPDAARRLLKSLASRFFYKRLVSLHYSALKEVGQRGTSEWEQFQKISSNWNNMLRLSKNLQTTLLVEVRSRAPIHQSTALTKEKLQRFDELMGDSHLSILVDIPPIKNSDFALIFVKETMENRYLDVSSDLMGQVSEAWMDPVIQLFRSIAVVRVFCHPEVQKTIRAVLDYESILNLAKGEINKL